MWAALLPDGELSLFEQRLLEAHCAHCAECRELRDSVLTATALVRDTPLEAMERRVRVLSARPRYWRSASGVLASGGAAVLALALAVWVGSHARSEQAPSQVTSVPVIVFTPESSTAANEAIWRFKRQHGVTPAPAGETRHTGPVL